MRRSLLASLLLLFALAADGQPVRNLFARQQQRSSSTHAAPSAQVTPATPARARRHAGKQGPTTGLPDGFVKVQDGRFVVGDSCKEFYFAGWNMWEVVELGSNAPSPPFRYTPKKGQEHIRAVFDQGVAAGMKVVRIWAHSITPGWVMQPTPGHYNETIVHGLDFVLAEAGKRGLKVIMVLADNWYKTNGIDNYVEWGGSSKHQDFFTSGYIRQLYKNNIAFLAKRVNPLTGVRYADDTTIMAWNVANEARCQGCGNGPMQNWISDVCSFIKSVAPNHLVGLGYEGFYGPDSGRTAMNPADWASREGQNYVANSQIGCIDYVSLHVWPDNWNLKTPRFQQDFIRAHLQDVVKSVPGKPFLLEEFGKITEDTAQKVRNQYFTAAYEVAEENVQANGPLQGTLFWHWYDAGIGPGQYGVHTTDTTWPIITAHVDFMNQVYADAPDLCPA